MSAGWHGTLRTVFAAMVVAVIAETRAQAPREAGSDRPLPFESGWELSGAGTRIEAHQGRRALRMRTGTAMRRDVSLEDGTIDFDVAMPRRRAFVYVLFRMASDGEREEIYLRPHKSGLPDAIQYSPVWRGESNWQLYHGPTGTASAAFPADTWIHVRVVLKGRRAALFLGEGRAPAMVVPLARAPAAGYLGFQAFTPEGGAPPGEPVAAYANVVVRPGYVPHDFGPDAPAPAPPPGMIGRWQVSPAVEAQSEPLTELPASILESKDRWPAYAAEDTGVLVFGRHVRRPAPVSAAIARLVLRASADTLQRLHLGYSDYATVFLNGRPLVAGDAHYSYENPRQDGFIGLWQATVWLPLSRGDNELLVAVVDGFGGWGLTARLETADGAELVAPVSAGAAAPDARIENTPPPLPRDAPAELGFGMERLDRLHASLRRLVDEGRCSGFVTLIARHGRIADWRAYGWRDVQSRAPMQPNAIVRIASNSKLVTSVGAMALVEEGRLDLDAPVERYLPELKGRKVLVGGTLEAPKLTDAQRPVTIRQLMTHTAGFATDFGGEDTLTRLYRQAKLEEARSLGEFVTRAARLPLAHQPGAEFRYGISTDLLGAVIEKAAGQDLDAFLLSRVFQPLGMADTGFAVAPEQRSRLANLYRRAPDGRLVEEEDSVGGRPVLPYRSGGAGLFSTAGDYARFAQMLLNGGTLDGVRILGRKTIEYMTLNHLAGTKRATHAYSEAHGFGMGSEVLIDPGRARTPGSQGQYGWYGGATTYVQIDPVEDLVAIALFQHVPMDEPGVFSLFPLGYYAALIDSAPGPAQRRAGRE